MASFTLYNPVRLRFGRGESERFAEEIPQGSRVLIVYGQGSVVRSGLLDRIQQQLAGRVAWCGTFGGVQPNPEYSQLIEALPIIAQEGVDFLLAVGGGSVVDGTKFIAAAARYTGAEPWEFLTKPGLVQDAIPMGAVMTLPATGSEMNHLSVVSRSELGVKLGFGSSHVYPRFSVVDPVLTETLPQRQVANGVVDAFVHVLEQYLVAGGGAPIHDRFAEGILSTLVEVGEATVEDPTNAPARDAMCYAATMALNGLIGAGLPQDWSTHQIGHELTALWGIDHARSLAAIMFDNFELRFSSKQERIAQYGRRVWGLAGSDESVARAALEKTRSFFEALGVPTSLGAYEGIGENPGARVVANLAITRPGKCYGEDRSVTPEMVQEIVDRSAARA